MAVAGSITFPLEFGYERERPRYKRKLERYRPASGETERAATRDDLIERLARLSHCHGHRQRSASKWGLPSVGFLR